jgi:hypothetical protein
VDYSKVNKALAKEFGAGQVEVRPVVRSGSEYVIWFRSDNPGKSVVEKATQIVRKYQPTKWFFSRKFRSE